jgi:hypothetical protein
VKSVGLFYGHLVHFMTMYLVYFVGIWYILDVFGIFCRHLIYFVGIRYIL